MKYLLLISILILTGCESDPKTPPGLPGAIGKFKDGNITCYTFYQKAISCVKE